MNDSTINLNLDAQTLEMCLKAISNFGGTIYNDICTGESAFVPWGMLDWFVVLFFIAIGIMFMTLIGKMAFSRW